MCIMEKNLHILMWLLLNVEVVSYTLYMTQLSHNVLPHSYWEANRCGVNLSKIGQKNKT